MANEFGLGVLLEYSPRMTQRTLHEARTYVTKIRGFDVPVCVDALHTFRGGTPLEQIKNAPPGVVARAQLCDAMASIHPADGLHEAIYERMVPGEGQLDLVQFIEAVPDAVVIGIEVPQKSLQRAGISHGERVRRCVAASLRLLSAAGRARDVAAESCGASR